MSKIEFSNKILWFPSQNFVLGIFYFFSENFNIFTNNFISVEAAKGTVIYNNNKVQWVNWTVHRWRHYFIIIIIIWFTLPCLYLYI
jgi:hypothetical protein